MNASHPAYRALDHPYNEIIQCVVTNLFSFNTENQEKVLKHYYQQDAAYVSPVLSTAGIDNIRRVLLVWKALNRKEPNITNICFDGQRTCTVFLTQNLCPRIIPAALFHISLPVVVTLTFEDVDDHPDLIKIARHEEHWTAQGLMDALPMLAHDWYERLVRIAFGQLLATAGHLIHSANETAILVSMRGREIEEGFKQLEQTKGTRMTAAATNNDRISQDSESSATDVDVAIVTPSKA